MWYQSESKNEPNLMDDKSSEIYVYVRKDIKEIEKEEEIFYSYQEKKIKKEDWSLYENILTNKTNIDELEIALEEVYEMIGE